MYRNKFIFAVILVCLLVCTGITYSQTDTTKHIKFKKQFSVSAGMGISYGTSPSFTSYLQEVLPLSRDSVRTFNVGIEFFGGLEYELSRKFSLRLEYAYFLRSISYNYSYFTFDYFINIHQPYLMANYLMKYNNFEIKIGGGAGYHLASLENKQNPSNPLTYTSSGLGLKAEGVFAAYLSKNFHSYISVFIAGSFLGALKDSNGNNLKSPLTNSDVKLGGVNGGVRLGFIIVL